MSVKLYLFECGTLKSQKHLFTLNRGVGEPFEVPVLFFLIQHNGKNILFDTGNAFEVSQDPKKHWGETVNTYYPVMDEKQYTVNQLKDILDIKPEQIDYVILSHLHLDHAGAVGAFPNAQYITHEQEYTFAFSPDCPQVGAYIMQDIDKDVNWLKLKNEFGKPYDLLGDGVIQIYHTPGHTPGHLSVLLKLDTKQIFLASDSCYTHENLNDNIPPGLVWDEESSIKSVNFIRELRGQGVEIITGHDPHVWKKFEKAPHFYS